MRSVTCAPKLDRRPGRRPRFRPRLQIPDEGYRDAASRCRPDQSGVPLPGWKRTRSRAIRSGVDYQSWFRGRDLFPRVFVRATRQTVRTERRRKGHDGAGNVDILWDRSTTSSKGSLASNRRRSSGLVFGTIFAVTGRIWMLMCAHAAFDLTALAIIYWGLESDVAHLVFK